MTKLIANILSLAIAVTLILLAVESDSILQWFGYGFGVMFFLASVVSWRSADNRHGDS
jgi:bacteriorhodopsin